MQKPSTQALLHSKPVTLGMHVEVRVSCQVGLHTCTIWKHEFRTYQGETCPKKGPNLPPAGTLIQAVSSHAKIYSLVRGLECPPKMYDGWSSLQAYALDSTELVGLSIYYISRWTLPTYGVTRGYIWTFQTAQDTGR